MSSLCSTSLPASRVVSVLNFGHYSSCIVVSHCFNLRFHDDNCGTSFHILVCYLYTPFDEVSGKVFGSLLIQVVYFPIVEF